MPEETVPLIPDPARTMEGLRDMGYSFETAVADLVDNSIAANATTVDISVQLDFRGQVRIAIADDGHGMDRQHLEEAMTYGFGKAAGPRKPRQVWPWPQDGIHRMVPPSLGCVPTVGRRLADDGYMGSGLRRRMR